MVERQRKVAEIIRKDPAVLYVNSTVGVGGPNPTAQPGPHARRAEAEGASAGRSTRSCRGCAARPAHVTGMTVFFQMIQNINVGGRINKSQYQYTLQSSDTDDALPDRAGAAREDRQARRACSTSPPISTSPIRR